MDSDDDFLSWVTLGGRLELPLHGLRELTRLRRTLDQLERELVLGARRNRFSWADIGCALDISRQAAHMRHRPSVKRADGDSPRPTS